MTPIFGFHPLALIAGAVAAALVVFALGRRWAPRATWKGCPNCSKAIQKDRSECPFCGAQV